MALDPGWAGIVEATADHPAATLQCRPVGRLGWLSMVLELRLAGRRRRVGGGQGAAEAKLGAWGPCSERGVLAVAGRQGTNGSDRTYPGSEKGSTPWCIC